MGKLLEKNIEWKEEKNIEWKKEHNVANFFKQKQPLWYLTKKFEDSLIGIYYIKHQSELF